MPVLRIRALTAADIPLGMRLKAQAGWNQLEADWRRLIELEPDGGFVAECDAAPVGTVTTCRFGTVGWVAMMLVDERHRGRGIGRRLMERALEYLDARGVRSVRLDATPLGRPLYESLGFAVETSLTRFQGVFAPAARAPELDPVSTIDGLDEVAALDRAVTGTDRGALLRRLDADSPGSLRGVRGEHGLAGFLMTRPGARARQIGPCLGDERAGPLLFADARERHAGEPVYIDIPAANAAATALAAALGLEPGRPLTRMGHGPRITEQLDRLWASAGPEKG
jgi:GNAT superfamily N-acetyltransferase